MHQLDYLNFRYACYVSVHFRQVRRIGARSVFICLFELE